MVLTVAADPVPLRTEADGSMRIGKTRVTLDILIAAFHDRLSPEEIVQQITVLDLADVYAVLAFYLRHQEAVDAYLAEREQQAIEIRAKIEALQGPRPEGLRQRLLARQAQQQS